MLLRTLNRLLVSVLATLAITAPAHAQSFMPGEFDEAIPTVTEVNGKAPGTFIATPAESLTYFKALQAAAPDRVKIVEYGKSWQGRPLNYIVISSAANMARLDAIQSDLQTIAAGRPGNGSALPVTWLTYSVHGNEVTCTDAAMMMAYHLLAAKGDARVDQMMEKSIIVIDPVQNPDGRQRFINNFRGNLGLEPLTDRLAAEHDETWPSGRVNHYMFDLNRDWFALTQPETKAKVKAMLSWAPVVVADVHEMGGDETYFFNPGAEPISPNITATQLQSYELIGQTNAGYFDRMGEPYFTREIFDLFYPGYGDTWNTHHGAIGMTFEQGSPRGLIYERSDGSVLTYAEATRNHFVASFGTADAVASNADRFLSNYAAYRRSNAQGAAGRGAYVIDLSKRRWNAEALGRRLAAQGIKVVRRDGSVSVCGKNYPQGYLAVPQAQPAARLVKSLLDKNTELPREYVAEQERRRSQDLRHELYDVTAWSVGLMSGLDVATCGSAVGGETLSDTSPIAAKRSGSGDFAVAVPWTDSGQARLATTAIRSGLVGRVTDKAFTSNGRRFPRGTVVFAAGDNEENALARLEAMSAEIGAETVRMASSWVQDGPNIGSGSFVKLQVPKIAIAWDDGISQLSAGALRFVVERRIGLPVTPIRTTRFGRADLSNYDVVIVPEGSPSRFMGSGGMRNLRGFVEGGGVLVTVGRSIDTFARGDSAMLSVKREAALGRDLSAPEAEKDGPLAEASEIGSDSEYRDLIRDQRAMPDTLPGALLNVVADPDNFLSAGYDGGAVVNASGSAVYTPLDRASGINAVRFADADNLIASGYVWSENQRQMAFKPFLMAQRTGSGLTIGFAHDPSLRGYLDGLDLMIANAVLVAPSRVR